MTDRKPLTLDLISVIANSIDTIPPRPASRHELELLITGIEAQVRAAQDRGCTYTEIAEQITRNGYPIKSSTLRVAMQRHGKAAAAKSTRTKPASRASKSVPPFAPPPSA